MPFLDFDGLKEFKATENSTIASVESTTTASKAYNIGDFFWYAGKLYKATAPIASGATITIGTNCSLAPLANDVSALKSALGRYTETLSTTDIRNAYPSSVIGEQVSFSNSNATKSIVNIISVEKDKKYEIMIANGSTVASSNIRKSVIVDNSNVVMQVVDIYTEAGVTEHIKFTANQDGSLILAVDKNYVNLSIDELVIDLQDIDLIKADFEVLNDAVRDVIADEVETSKTTMDDDSDGVVSYAGRLDTGGAYTASSGYKTCVFPITEKGTFYVDYPTSYKNLGIYSSSTLSGDNCINYLGQTGAGQQNENNQISVEAGQYVAASYRPQSATDLRVKLHLTVTEIIGHELKDDVELSDEMTAQVEQMIESAVPEITKSAIAENESTYPTSVSALLYRRNLPSYYLAKPDTFTSYDDDEYIQKRIDAIPKGKHFIFVTDTHWPSNAKKTNDLIAYVRSRIGNVDVVFGGDVVNANNTPYAAVKVIKEYFNESITAYGNKFIPVLGNHDTNQVGDRETTKAERFVPYSELADLFTKHLDGRAILRDETEAIATKTDDPAVAAEYDAYFKLNYVVNADNGITYIIYNTGATGIFNQEAFGLNGEDEIYLHQKWLHDTLMQVPEGNDVVLVGHEATYGITNPLNSWNQLSAVTLMCGFSAKQNVELYQMPAVINEKTYPWIPNKSYPSYDFTSAPNVGKVFMMQGHWHHDFVVKVGITADQTGYNYTHLDDEIWDGEETFSKASGEIPIITTICDAYGAYTKNNSYPTDPADWDMAQKLGTVEEQAFDVVTITDTGVVTTRFGAAEHPSDLLREFVMTE